jgi:colicin import membrane protein
VGALRARPIASARPVCYLPDVPLHRLCLFARPRRCLRAGAALALAAGLVVSAGEARAQGGGTAPKATATTTPPAPPGDGANAGRIIGEVEARAKKDKLDKVVDEPLRHARKALERANGARTAGDTAHARMLDGLALEWAETARDLLRAAAAEKEALATAKKAREIGVQVERARALLEETQARRGRAAADLERAEAEAKEATKKAAAVEAERVQKGRSKAGGEVAPKGGARASNKSAAGAPKGKK